MLDFMARDSCRGIQLNQTVGTQVGKVSRIAVLEESGWGIRLGISEETAAFKAASILWSPTADHNSAKCLGGVDYHPFYRLLSEDATYQRSS
jgi:hypothetical protein